MLKKGCVPGCISNYYFTKYYITVFKFPTDSDMREKWKQCHKCVSRKDWSPSKSTVICSKHFRPCDMILSETFTDNNVVQHERPRKNAVLKANEFLSLFPGLLSDLITAVPQPGKDPELTCLVLYTICVKADTAHSIAVSVKVLPDMYGQV
ncbi:hypothetical protein BsWGS_19352 [Bradybaena similaris]